MHPRMLDDEYGVQSTGRILTVSLLPVAVRSVLRQLLGCVVVLEGVLSLQLVTDAGSQDHADH